ncbi:MAG: alpha/beta fold hydrolase, partial [Jiangellaceae bacterium]
AGVVGGSMGGMRALEWAVSWPDRVASLLVLASCAAASAEQIGLCSAQIHAIRADPEAGLGIARRIAHLSYRSEAELAQRFGREAQPGEDPLTGGRYAVESYLDHHAAKLIRRFDPNSYVALSEAMNSHDVGRSRGGVQAALARVTARTLVVGIDSDRLYPLSQQRTLADDIPGCPGLQVVPSAHGHDGFLIEIDPIGKLVRESLGSGSSPVIQSGSLSS